MSLVGTIGTLEAMETIKLLANYGKVNQEKYCYLMQ